MFTFCAYKNVIKLKYKYINTFSLKIQLTLIHSMPRLISMSQAGTFDSQAVAWASELLKSVCVCVCVWGGGGGGGGIWLKSCCTKQSDRIYYEIFSRYGWSHSSETHLTPRKSVRVCFFTYGTSHLKFAHERSVTSSGHEGTPAWTKAKPSSSKRSH